MTTEINKILSEWDPIGVGMPLSLDEYKTYAIELSRLPPDEKRIKNCIIHILGKIGLDYQLENALQNKEIDDVVKKVLIEKEG